MANSKLSLINNALILIGDVPLTSLTSGTRAQVVATSLYDNIVENELSKFRWGFARKVAQLSLDVAAPIGNEWESKYTLPADMLNLIKLDPSINYQIIENKVYCNYSADLFCDYIAMELLANQYLNASRMARFTDSQQHPQTPIQDRPFINVRY